MEAGVDGLLRDKTRKPGKAPVPGPIAARLIERTLGKLPGETTHWTSRAMAKVAGLAISTVQKIWRAHGLAKHHCCWMQWMERNSLGRIVQAEYPPRGR